MAITISQSASATGPKGPASFGATGGVAPYVFSVVPNGAGGTIDPSSGLYTGPAVVNSDPNFAFDSIVVTDSLLATATAKILVGTAFILLADIIQNQMNLANDQVWIWDQKINIPVDSRLYVALSMPICYPFASGNTSVSVDGGGLNQVQTVNMAATVDVDILSRGPQARDRKEEVILALSSVYAQQQQEANAFTVLKLSEKFLNLNTIDGAAIPYRYKISFQMQYAVTKIQPAQYFDTFSAAQVTLNNP